ncbi:MAG TPA: permease-like cell division protein FtsX [Candidatus Binatia bacterium]|nr:permease-like cell division protein FtsX [Candidatus Binatia bacterium]
MFVSLYRVVKFAFQNFFRNAWLSIATVSVLVLTLVSVNVLLVLNVLGKVAITTVRSKIDVSVHFKPEIEDSRVQTVKIFLLSLPEVKDVQFISPGEALQKFNEDYKSDTGVIESLGEVGTNPFGATLVVQAHDLQDYPKIMGYLADPLYSSLIEAKDYDDRQMMIARVEDISRKLEMFGIGVSAIFGLITLLIVWNTIRVSIYTRKEEIGIMRLVGASDGFIRAPFYVEAIIWSVLSFIACFALVWPAVRFAQPFLQNFFGTGAVDIVGFYSANLPAIVAFEFGSVAIMGLITSKMATAKYLKV